MNETDLMHSIEDAISKQGHTVFRYNVGRVQTRTGGWFEAGPPVGHPDLAGFLTPTGKAFYIECKVAPNKPTVEQLNFIRMANNRGALAGVAYSVEDALNILKDAMWDKLSQRVIIDAHAEDMPGDSAYWISLLCWSSDCRELFDALSSIRMYCGRLVKDPKWGMRIEPGQNKEQFAKDRKILSKYREQLTEELKWLGGQKL